MQLRPILFLFPYQAARQSLAHPKILFKGKRLTGDDAVTLFKFLLTLPKKFTKVKKKSEFVRRCGYEEGFDFYSDECSYFVGDFFLCHGTGETSRAGRNQTTTFGCP
jgi:hypothetical protein